MNELHSTLLTANDNQTLVTTLAAVAGMPIPPAHLPAVTAHLKVAAAMAQLLFAAPPYADDAIPAPVYTPPSAPQS